MFNRDTHLIAGQTPRIFLNDNIVSHAAQRGVTRYFQNVADGIINRFGGNTIIYSSQNGDYKQAKHIRPIQFRGSRRLGLHDYIASMIARKERASVIFSPYYGNTWTNAASVFTVHDMIHELYPSLFLREQRAVRRFLQEKKRCIERAEKLIAVSNNTAKDIVACYPNVAAHKIAVVYHGVDAFFFNKADDVQVDIKKPFFLYVGHRTFHKNFSRLLTAFGQSGLARDFDLRVISPDTSGFTNQERKQIQQYHIQPHVQLVTNVDELTLRASYASAAAFVYPSEYEGFGLPILEAMASGTLVATSNTSSMPEVGGDVALYFDPCDPESITDCLQKITSLSTEQRSDRISAGIARARTFTWERCQQQTAALFEEIGSF